MTARRSLAVTRAFSIVPLFLAASVFSEPLPKEEAAAVMEAGFEPVAEAPALRDFSLDDPAGKAATLSSWRGEVILVNFWATWCPPCREELPSMERLYQSLKTSGLVLLAVSSSEKPSTVHAFLDKNPLRVPVLLDTTGAVASQYGVQAFPTTYLIDRQGRVVGVRLGGQEWSSPESLKAIRRFLALR